MTQKLKIAVAGLGVVGCGLLRLIAAQGDHLARSGGRPLAVTAVSARVRHRDRGVDLSAFHWYDDPVAMAREADADVIVELIGGSDGIAAAVCEAALAAGKHVVTANKALLAMHGQALARTAEDAGLALGYEAAVAGGIPIIKTMREGFAGNRIESVRGILNGTCNYILTSMRSTGADFATALTEAQELGYAEAVPDTDIDGIDAAHKLALLTSLAFGTEVDFAGVHIEGIRNIRPADLRFATELGFRIKLLGMAEKTAEGIRQRVHPTLVPIASPMGSVEGVFNAVETRGDFVGLSMLEGRGAGADPTASAVAADLLDIASGRIVPAFGVPASAMKPAVSLPMQGHVGAWFIRLRVIDRPGVIADISAALRDRNISMESMIQKGRDPNEPVDVVMTVHETRESLMMDALTSIRSLDAICEPPHLYRITRD